MTGATEGHAAMEAVFDAILGLGGTTAYVIIGLLAFGEAAAFVGLVLPGEVAVLLGGVLASQGRVSLAPLLVAVVVAAIAGDSAGYEIGRRWGPKLLDRPAARRHAGTIRDAKRYLRHRAGPMIFLGRWTSVLRAVVPALAGMSRVPYGRFLVFNVLGGVAWAVAFTFLGYAAGESYGYIESATGWGSWVVTGVLVAWLTRAVVRRRRRRRTRPRVDDRQSGAEHDGESGTEHIGASGASHQAVTV
jgi:membrane protein DedA with SNARE-associated domain